MVVRFSCLRTVSEEVKEKYCELGHNGDCCCNCIHQLKLMCHPWNKEFGKGSISEQCGYVCKVLYEDGSNARQATFSDSEHGMCEMHMTREGLKNLKLKIQKEKYK